MTAGLLDAYTPKNTQAALAAAYGLPLIEPVAEAWPVLDLLDIPASPSPAQGNRRDARGRALTAGVLQYPDEGHFAVFTDASAQEAYRRFFETLRQGIPIALVGP
jgi:hypothetical protein